MVKGRFSTIVQFDWTTQSSDEIITKTGYLEIPGDSTSINYKSHYGPYPIGKINLINHVLKSGHNKKEISNNKGYKITILESIYYSVGSYTGPGLEINKTSGYGIQIDRLFRILAPNTIPKPYDKITLGYFSSEVIVNYGFGTRKYKGLTLGYRF